MATISTEEDLNNNNTDNNNNNNIPTPTTIPTSEQHLATADEIDATIRRGAVEPGTGARKLNEVGNALWTRTDQDELDRLLAEGQDVYVPPDVDDNDLPAPRARGYSYTVKSSSLQVPTSTSTLTSTSTTQQKTLDNNNKNVDDSIDTRSMADRIAMWNQVVPSLDTNINNNISTNIQQQQHNQKDKAMDEPVIPIPIVEYERPDSILSSSPSQQQQQQQQQRNINNIYDQHVVGANTTTPIPNNTIESYSSPSSSQQQQQQQYQGNTVSFPPPPTSPLQKQQASNNTIMTSSSPLAPQSSSTVTTYKPQQNVDVSRTIFGGTFLTVPVVSRQSQHQALTLHPDFPQDQQQQTTTTTPTNTLSLIQQEEEEEEGATVHEVLLRCESSAHVDVTADYGLKGGHTSIVHDATFVHNDKKLVTCGADGKVCIWDMTDRSVQYEFTPYEHGEPVIMVYPLASEEEDDDEEESDAYTLMTLSESRVLRIWLVDGAQAIMLRNSQIKQSEADLYMTVTPISKALKQKAIAAAAAAAVRTSDQPMDEVQALTGGTADGETELEEDEEDDNDVKENTKVEPEEKDDDDEEEHGRKRFSLSKVLSFTRTGSKKAVAG